MPKLNDETTPEDAVSLALAGLIYSNAVAPIVGNLTYDEFKQVALHSMHAARVFIDVAENQ